MINYNQENSDLWGGVCDTLVPFYDVPISCGLPNEVGDIPAEMILVPGGCFDGLETYTVRAKGDSMIGVGINDGDLLMMQKISQVHNYDIVLATIDGESLIKTYYQDDKGRHWLVPANDDYEPILLTEVTMFADANDKVRRVRHRSRGLRAPCREAPPRCFS